MKLSILLLLALSPAATAFCPADTGKATVTSSKSSSTQLNVWFPNDGMEAARGSFPLWLFGAAGSGGIARNAVPKVLDDIKALQGLKQDEDDSKTKMGLSALAIYPQDLYLEDVTAIVNNKLSVTEIVEKYPIEGNYLSTKRGYLTLDAFQLANANQNPLAVQGVFESFRSTLVVEPFIAQEKLDQYKEDPYLVTRNLLINKLGVYSAILALLFLLGLADVATATDLYRGWFPDWPGGIDFPLKLFTEDGSPFTIGDYWMWDIPEDRF